MKLTILGASGATGRELVRQALERGHHVRAVARRVETIHAPDHERLTRVAGDVDDPASIAAALAGSEVVVSVLGLRKGQQPGVLERGARAAAAANPQRILALGALGTGHSADPAGGATRALLKLVMGAEIPDKVAADAAVLAAGGTVFHAGPMSNSPESADRRTVALAELPRRFFPAGVSRATVAAAMLDEAETPRFAGAIAIPLAR